MWLCTTYGFFSAVCPDGRPFDGPDAKGKGCVEPKHVDTTQIMIRARSPKHLAALQAGFPALLGTFEVIESPARDYRWRILVPRETFVQLVTALATEVDYGNFKKRVGSADPEYASMLGRVWGLGYTMQGAQREPDLSVPESRQLMIDELSKLPTRDFVRLVRRETGANGWTNLDTTVWRALVKRGWAEVRGQGASMRFDLTAEGRTRLGVAAS